VNSLSANAKALKGHLLSVEGLVDHLLEDPTHVTFSVLVGDNSANAYVLKGTNGPPPAFKPGDFVRIKCVYSPQFDRSGNVNDLSCSSANSRILK